MAEIKNNLFELYSEKALPRKTLEQLSNKDPEAASKQLAKSKDFAIKMMLANAKNNDPFAENDNKATEMLQTANLIAQLDSASVQVQEMQKMAEAVKNPGYNALDLHGKQVSYDNSTHLFDGKSPVNFSYNINHPEDENTSNVTATINIKDGAGNVVYTYQEFNLKKGEHNFVWDGMSNERKKLALGVYSIDVVAAGKKTINGVDTSFKVDSKSFLSGVVESVEIQNGQATKLILENGRSITKDQVISSGSVKSDKSLVELSPDLIYKHVELDLSKAQANSSGQLKVYYHNNVASPGKMAVRVYDAKNKLAATLQYNKEISKGVGMIAFENTGLSSGNYTVEVTIEDKDNSNAPVVLKSEATASVVGINYENKTFISSDEKEYSAHNIKKIIVDYLTPLQSQGEKYMNLPSITYKNDRFKYQSSIPFAPEITAKKDLDGNIFSHSIMTLYDADNNLVKTIYATDELFSKLDNNSKNLVTNHCRLNYHGAYNALSENEQREVNDYIRAQINANTWTLDPQFVADFAKNDIAIKFPAWDGTYNNGITGKAQDEGIYRAEFTPIYLKNDGTTVAGVTTLSTAKSKVTSFDIQGDELLLNLQDGNQITEDLVVVQ